MSEARPPWKVVKRDGRVEPFEPEKLQHTLFAATERLGAPNPFLARELTDGVVHFLAAEAAGRALPTSEIAETVAKVVREFGHAALADAYEAAIQVPTVPKAARSRAASNVMQGPATPITAEQSVFEVERAASAHSLREYSLGFVWPREFVSAHRDGLLHLTGLETPLEMAGVVLPHVRPESEKGPSYLEGVAAARAHAGQFLAIDGPEYALAGGSGSAEERIDAFLSELRLAADATGLTILLNLNHPEPPPWDADMATGPLFPPPTGQAAEEAPRLASGLALQVTAGPRSGLRIWWHVRESDFEPAQLPTLLKLAASAADGSPVEFVFDRPKRPVALGPGLDRRHPAVVAVVGINLPALVMQLGAGPADRAVFLKKLGSLTRFAKSAGHVRQDYLRRHARPSARAGFLLERSRLVVVPAGLDAAVRTLLGPESSSPGLITDFGKQVLSTIREALASDRPRVLDSVIDSPLEHAALLNGGICLADASLTVQQQIKAASGLHHAAGGGSAYLALAGEQATSPEQLADLLRASWESDVARVALRRSNA
jgi:ATP cone domain